MLQEKAYKMRNEIILLDDNTYSDYVKLEDAIKVCDEISRVGAEVRPENGDFKDIIVEYSKTKRRLNIPFAVCGGKKELTQMARKILKKAKHKDFIYGWIDVVGKPEPIKNTAPKNWDE